MEDEESSVEDENASVNPLQEPTYTQQEIDNFKWVNLPDGYPAVLLTLLDKNGEPCTKKKARVVVAIDEWLDTFQFAIRENTFDKPRLN